MADGDFIFSLKIISWYLESIKGGWQKVQVNKVHQQEVLHRERNAEKKKYSFGNVTTDGENLRESRERTKRSQCLLVQKWTWSSH